MQRKMDVTHVIILFTGTPLYVPPNRNVAMPGSVVRLLILG
jgi:hypothetical protein